MDLYLATPYSPPTPIYSTPHTLISIHSSLVSLLPVSSVRYSSIFTSPSLSASDLPLQNIYITFQLVIFIYTSTIKQIPPIRLHMFVPLPYLCHFFCFSLILACKPFVFGNPWQAQRFPNLTRSPDLTDHVSFFCLLHRPSSI